MKRHSNSPASILAQLKNIAKANNVVFAEILNRYAIERILKRIELSSRGNQCILKGGCLFILWSDGFSYRPTMDADLEIRGRGDIVAIEELFHEVANIVPGEPDGISVDERSIRVGSIRADDEYGGVRAVMIVHIGKVRVHVQFDIGIGDAITPLARKNVFPALLEMSPPRIKVYPKATVIAEKLETIAKRGLANSRMKDYYDLWVLSREECADLSEIANAVVRTFARRKTEMPRECPYGLTQEFAQNADKTSQWAAFVRKSRLTGLAPDFSKVVSSIHDFYNKIQVETRGRSLLIQ